MTSGVEQKSQALGCGISPAPLSPFARRGRAQLITKAELGSRKLHSLLPVYPKGRFRRLCGGLAYCFLWGLCS